MQFDAGYPSVRQPLIAKNIVATSQPLAAQAGVRTLLRGGNAIDAAVAAAYGWPAALSEDDILARLLKLNLKRAAEEEAAAPLPSTIKTKSSRPQRAKDEDEIL